MLEYALGGETPQTIFEAIAETVGDKRYIALNVNKTCSSISMFDSVVFRIRINSRTQCLDTDNSIALDYVPNILGATQTKGVAHIPLISDTASIIQIKAMIRDIYKQCRSQVSGDTFGCCNDHVRCSDAGYCLHLEDREYWGCYYRKNLEAGRIFYGKNRNEALSDGGKITVKKYCRGNYVHRVAKDYCVVDTETTGLSAYFDSIIEIGILKVRDNVIVDEYTQLIDPECELNPFITNLTGITPEMLEGQPTIEEVREEVLAFIGNDLIVGHSTNFDMQFLTNGFCYDFPNEYMDTLQFSKKIYPEFRSHGLSALARQLKLPVGGHRALSDCKSTKALLDCMIAKALSTNMSINDLFSTDISKIVPTKEVVEDSFFYGKHCVFTGKLEKMTRKEAMQMVVNAGGVLDQSVNSATQFLIVGSFEYCSSIKEGKTGKMKRAEVLKQNGQDIEIMDEYTFYDLVDLENNMP